MPPGKRSPRPRARLGALAAAVVAALAFAVLAACGEPPKKLVLWHYYRGDEQRALDEVLRAFEAESGLAVHALSVPYDAYAAKVEAAVPRGNGPDVFLSPHERLGTYVRDGLVGAPGDAFPDDDVAAYDPGAVRAVTVGGERRGVPLASKCVALYVNDRLLPGELPPTLEALVAMPGRPAGGYALAYEAQTIYYHAGILHAFGGRLFDGEALAMQGPEAEAAARFVKGLFDAHALPDEPSGNLVKQLFVSGKAAAVVSGPWLAAELKTDVPWHVEPLPPIEAARGEGRDGRPRPLLAVDAALLTPASAERADARRLLRHLGSEASARVRARVGRQVVATEAAWSAPEIAADRFLSAFHDAARSAEPLPTDPRMRATWVPAEQALKRVLRGDASPADAFAEARARFDDAVRPPPPPASPWPLVLALSALSLAGAAVAVRRARREPGQFARRLRRSAPAYAYVAHAVVVVTLLVIVPLVVGSLASFFAGTPRDLHYVGLDHYASILTARGKPLLGHGSFWLVLCVTVLWTVANVVLHVVLGVGLGLLLARPWLKTKAVYRVLLVLPWAVPSYVTALAWKGMFHRQFGAINAVLAALGAEPVAWFSKFSTAFAANLATNVWLGFPFMMVVTLGALTSIPKEVLEAAEVDGATPWQRFRLVTLPLLRPALLPSVVLGAVWTFNMFNVVFLVSGGEPDGSTDILVSEAYRWAFARGAQVGYAAAYAVLIFGLLALGTRLLERLLGDARDEAPRGAAVAEKAGVVAVAKGEA